MVEKKDEIILKDLEVIYQFINFEVINKLINNVASIFGATFNRFSSMRKRFEQQLQLGQLSISQIKVNPKYRSGFPSWYFH